MKSSRNAFALTVPVLIVAVVLLAVEGISSANSSLLSNENVCGTLSGIISEDITLTEDCTYEVLNNLLVDDPAKLTIHPGVTLAFTGEYYLQVEGILNAVGTEEKPITFTSGSTHWTGSDWRNIRLAGTNRSVISHTIIEYAGAHDETPLVTSNGSHLLDNILFRAMPGGGSDAGSIVSMSGNQTLQNSSFAIPNIPVAVWIRGGGAKLIDNTFDTYNMGIGVGILGGNVLVQGNVFRDNDLQHAAVGLFSTTGPVTVTHNSFVRNTYIAAHPEGSAGAVQVRNDIVHAVVIECNLFLDNEFYEAQPSAPAANITLHDVPATLTVMNNSIYPPATGYSFSVEDDTSSETIIVEGNYWETTDSSQIEELIWHYPDDFNLPEVDYQPFLAEAPGCVPMPPPTPSPTHTATYTPTPSTTPTATPTVRPTLTRTNTPAPEDTPTPTSTPTLTSKATSTPTSTPNSAAGGAIFLPILVQ